MAARTPDQALATFIDQLQVVTSCVAREVIERRRTANGPHSHHLSLGRADPVRIGRQRELVLRAEIWCDLIREEAARLSWQVRIAGYVFELIDRGRSVTVTYHWHQKGSSPVEFPHLHVKAEGAAADLRKLHLPTGPITLVDVIRCAITEFGVQPLRADWRAVLDRADQALANRV